MKKKVLFVNGHLNVGGVENSLLNVLKNIDFDTYDVDLILFEDLGDYASEVPKEVNIKYYDLSKAFGPIKKCFLDNIKERNWFAICLRVIFLLEKNLGPWVLSIAKPLFKLQKTYDCAIAYRVGICTDFVGYLVDSTKKITWWHHGTYDIPQNQQKRWIKVLSRFDRLIAVSDSSKKMLNDNIPGINKKLLTIPNIINVEEIQKKANEPINDINFTEDVTLLSVGRLSPEKGMINCVHSCKKLVEKGFDVKWYLIGEGIERDRITRCIKEYNLENNIFLLGSISNPYPYIKNANIYVHPSLVESLSITVLEALALNTPVIVAESMGPKEFIRHKENGLLVDSTPEGLADGIVYLLEDNHIYKQLNEDKSELLRNYSPAVIMKKIFRLIEVG
ncbi:glycosyltransferase [Metabacillus litoralis]|uniref:glycosyltransferase n=1 Tax=Metabacillus litoralis TaxID=152268 RepID=UPI000EF62C82|nr:glycosyltransferase [Metabacillus litoralis]